MTPDLTELDVDLIERMRIAFIARLNVRAEMLRRDIARWEPTTAAEPPAGPDRPASGRRIEDAPGWRDWWQHRHPLLATALLAGAPYLSAIAIERTVT